MGVIDPAKINSNLESRSYQTSVSNHLGFLYV